MSNASTGTVASEIWALGATLYTFAAGHSPFEHADRAQNTQSKMISRITAARVAPIAGAQGYELFDSVMVRAMQSKPEARFASMREFAEALQHLQRSYGFDVTPLDIVDSAWVTPAAENAGPRTPTPSAVRPESRAQRRKNAQQPDAPDELTPDRDGIVPDRTTSPVRAGLIGAAIGVGAIAAIVGLAMYVGWI